MLSTYYDLALLAESIRIQAENAVLLRILNRQAAVRLQAGTSTQQDLLKSQTEVDLAENDLANLRSQLAPTRAKMNALLGRGAGAPLSLPAALPPPRPLPVSDAELIRRGSERSTELAALARRSPAGKRL